MPARSSSSTTSRASSRRCRRCSARGLRGVRRRRRATPRSMRWTARARTSIMLDLGLPDMDGVEVCRRIREGRTLPILVLSARGAEADKVAALDAGRRRLRHQAVRRGGTAGADPRRAAPGRGALIAAGADRARRPRRSIAIGNRVRRGGADIRLTPKEFDLLVFLAQHPGRVLTHRVLQALWGPNAVDQPEHLRVLVAALRRKLERSLPPALHHDRAVGRLPVHGGVRPTSRVSSGHFGTGPTAADTSGWPPPGHSSVPCSTTSATEK